MAGPVSSETLDDSLQGSRDSQRLTEPQLIVALECDRPTAGASRFSLTNVNEVLIGRGPERAARRVHDHGYTTLGVQVPAPSLSSIHARLVRAREVWTLEDAGSRNGSFVNGHRVTRTVVRDNDIIEVGHVLLLVREAMEMHGGPADLDSTALNDEPYGFRTLVPKLADHLAALKRMAPTKVPILLLGETGTGKEVVAREVHILSGRRGPIVAINCGALPQSLVEAQLFGHVKGAFSGAARDEPGFIRSADHGTLFLDEVGELPPPSQATLLRVLQDGKVTPVGSSRATDTDVRVVSATHRSLVDDATRFRADLYARLAGLTFCLPPLRERIEDLGVALADILAVHAPAGGSGVTLSPEVGRLLLQHQWPFNFRELQQAVCAALALAGDGVLCAKHFPALRAVPSTQSVPPSPARQRSLSDEDDRLRIVLITHLREQGGNVSAVARGMRKAPMQVHRWMKRLGIDPREFRTREKA